MRHGLTFIQRFYLASSEYPRPDNLLIIQHVHAAHKQQNMRTYSSTLLVYQRTGYYTRHTKSSTGDTKQIPVQVHLFT